MANCRQCGLSLSPDAKFCPRCGCQQPAGRAYCGVCGAPAGEGTGFCGRCGAPLPTAPSPSAAPQRSQRVTVPPTSPGQPTSPVAGARSRRRPTRLWLLVIPVFFLCAGAMALSVIPALIDEIPDWIEHLARPARPLAPATPWVGLNPTLVLVGEQWPTDLPDSPRGDDARGVALSSEQQTLVDRFSYPDTFTLLLDPDAMGQAGEPSRLELWNYHVFGTCFKFADGRFRGIDAAKESAEAGNALLRPDQFHSAMSLEDVNQVVGDIPRVGAEVAPEVAEGFDVYVYDQGLVVGFLHGRLAYASTDLLAAPR
ncbi:MAG: zinc ribbon domain-containing protein [Anaerolineae bacterium]